MASEPLRGRLRGTRSGSYAAERRILLLDALRRLTQTQRAVLVLRYFEDLSEAEIALALGVSAGTVKSTAHLAMGRLRECAAVGTNRVWPVSDIVGPASIQALAHFS